MAASTLTALESPDTISEEKEGFMPKKETTQVVSSIAGKVLAGKKPTPAEARKLAASVLGQDETKGRRKPPTSPTPKKK